MKARKNQDLISKLPAELSLQIGMSLDSKSIISSFLVSHAWQGLFKGLNLWKEKIKLEFGINLNRFALGEEQDPLIFFQRFYCCLARLKYYRFPNIGFMEQNPSFINLVAVCLKDDRQAAAPVLHEYGYVFCLQVAIYAGCNQLAISLLNEQKNKIKPNFLYDACRAGNLKISRYLLDTENHFNLKVDQIAFHYACRSGNLELVNDLLENTLNFGTLLDEGALLCAVESGNASLVTRLLQEMKVSEDFWDLIYEFALKSGSLSLVKALHECYEHFSLSPVIFKYAAESGNLELIVFLRQLIFISLPQTVLMAAAEAGSVSLVAYLLDPRNQFEFTVTQEVLYAAVTSGNLNLVKYLLNLVDHLFVDKRVVNLAAESGNLKLLMWLVDPKNDFGFKPGFTALSAAASKGQFMMVSYLLNPKNGFHLKPNQTVLHLAISSGNTYLVCYLLNPHYGFDLITDKRSLKKAMALLPDNYAWSDNVGVLCEFFIHYALREIPVDGDTLFSAAEITSQLGGLTDMMALLLSDIVIDLFVKTNLSDNDFETAKEYLDLAEYFFSGHCNHFIGHMLTHPTAYELKPEAVIFLTNYQQQKTRQLESQETCRVIRPQ